MSEVAYFSVVSLHTLAARPPQRHFQSETSCELVQHSANDHIMQFIRVPYREDFDVRGAHS